MKHVILYKIVSKLKRDRKLRRTVTLFAVVGGVGFLIAGLVTVWAGLSAVTYLASSARQVIQSPLVKGQVQNLTGELESLPKFQAVTCWDKAQALLGVQPWIEKSALENLSDLKVACFGPNASECQGNECERVRDASNRAERSVI